MNKTELSTIVARRTGISILQTERTIDTFIDEIVNTLKKGDKVTLIGLGRLYTVQAKPRVARNPRTGETVRVPQKVKVRFTVGDKLKKMIA